MLDGGALSHVVLSGMVECTVCLLHNMDVPVL